jgi:hypothetical protein
MDQHAASLPERAGHYSGHDRRERKPNWPKEEHSKAHRGASLKLAPGRAARIRRRTPLQP